MENERFTDQMQAFGRWKGDLITAVNRYLRWLEKNQISDPETELRIFELIEALKTDQLTIAFVAEFARGKTELINAIFFSEYDRRVAFCHRRRVVPPCARPSCSSIKMQS